MTRGEPSPRVCNRKPKPRQQRWLKAEAVCLVRAPTRQGYHDLACIMGHADFPNDVLAPAARHCAGRTRPTSSYFADQLHRREGRTSTTTVTTESDCKSLDPKFG